ncbi:MAG: hypothetical protein RLZ12_605 [Bacillota bacterium]|jgi:3-oxoacyl-[acyl-carrier protein] reductase
MTNQKQTAWILGGSGAIGAAIVTAFARQYNVGIGYYTNECAGHDLATRLQKEGCAAQAYYTDLTDRTSIAAAYFKLSQELGSPSIIVHAAGDSWYGLVQEMPDQEYKHLEQVHLRSALYLVQTVLPYLLTQRFGRLIFISSLWGECGAATEVIYSAVKAAQIGFVKSLAKELAPSGITVNAVTPGAIDTPLLSRQLTQQEKEKLRQKIPLGRLGKPEEVAAAVVFLTESSYITGTTLGIDGGWGGL